MGGGEDEAPGAGATPSASPVILSPLHLQRKRGTDVGKVRADVLIGRSKTFRKLKYDN